MTFTFRTEADVQNRIRDVLSKFIGKKFNGITITEVKTQYNVDGRWADIAVLKDDGQPLLIIETKKKYERPGGYRVERRFHVMSEEVLGQVFSYAAILKRRGIYVPFVATANDVQIAVFEVPQDIDNNVNWDAIENREYGRVLNSNYIYEVLREKYLLRHVRIRFTEDFFGELLETITGIYTKKYRIEERRQPLSLVLIEDFRGFVETLTPFILDAIAPRGAFRDELARIIEEYRRRRGYAPTPEQLAREMAYVLLNKILFYKVLEKHYRLSALEPLYEGGIVKSTHEYMRALNRLFEDAVKGTGDFEAIFRTDIYDVIRGDMVYVVESEEVAKLLDWLIRLIDAYTIERLGDIIGRVYEDLIPAEERRNLGEFYTPKPIAELIAKWAIRSSSDKVLDPGCGSGTFLVEAYKRLFELKMYKPFIEVGFIPEDVHEQILNQLFGIDINEFPVHLTSMNLAMINPKVRSKVIQVIREDFFNVVPGQSRLVPYAAATPEGGKSLEIVFRDFDAVIGNPPYTRWRDVLEITKDRILSLYKDVLTKYGLMPQMNVGAEIQLYVYWIIHATRFLRDGGRLGMIISDSWLQANYGINFGRFLMDNYRVVAIIDIATRVFPVPLVGACIILLEKEPDVKRRIDNNIVFMLLRPRGSFNVNEVLRLIEEYSSKEPGYYRISDEVVLSIVKQGDVYNKNVKWVQYIFKPEQLLRSITENPLMKRLGDLFEVSRGNTLWSYWAISHGRRPDVGGEGFFYLNEDRARQLNIPNDCLYPLLSSSHYMPFFTFSKNDWDSIRNGGAECYLFLCHKPRNELPEPVLKYVQIGEGPNANIRTRNGRPISETVASQTRRRHRELFYDWYDLRGVIEAPVYATYGAQYWIRFVLSRFNCALDHRILALIPREGISFDENELKALLAYFNSSFTMLQAEVRGRATAGGMIELDVRPLSEFMVLDVKKLPRDAVERLAQLFDKLEAEARRLGGADRAENVFGSDLAKELVGGEVRPGIDGLFNTVIREIDYEVGKILGLSDAEVEGIRSLIIDMVRRRLARSEESGSIKGSEEEPTRARRRRRSETKPIRRLDEFFS